MATIRGGDGGRRRRRRRRRTRGHYISAESMEDHIGVGYSELHGFSTDCDVRDYDRSGRDKVLDDALFSFFRKQAVNNMKRKFTYFCQDTIGTAESPEREEYVLQLKNEHNKTRIFGPGYMKILKDYDMKKGDRFMVDLDYPPPFFAIFPEEGVDVPKQFRTSCFEGNATAVVFTRGLELTTSKQQG